MFADLVKLYYACQRTRATVGLIKTFFEGVATVSDVSEYREVGGVCGLENSRLFGSPPVGIHWEQQHL